MGCDCPARGKKRHAVRKGPQRAEFFFFSILHFILRFEKKPRSGPPTANCLQCCSKFVQPQFDFGGWRGNRIVDDFSFGCTAGGLSASVLSPLPPFFFFLTTSAIFSPLPLPSFGTRCVRAANTSSQGIRMPARKKTTEKKKLAVKEVKDSLKWVSVARRKNKQSPRR